MPHPALDLATSPSTTIRCLKRGILRRGCHPYNPKFFPSPFLLSVSLCLGLGLGLARKLSICPCFFLPSFCLCCCCCCCCCEAFHLPCALMASGLTCVLPSSILHVGSTCSSPDSSISRATGIPAAASSAAGTVPAVPRSALQQYGSVTSGFRGWSPLLTHNVATIIKGSKRSAKIVVMATGESESSNPVASLFEGLQEAWEKTDDKLAIGGLGAAALVILWASTGLISAIDKLPLLPAFFEFVGILFTGWFVYRYLLFKPDREELVKKIEIAKEKITGQ
ncbi:hypothetical protein O6H91_01G034600 [Diphasiastrum complanatum]|uniref:Uncharacterized protein n=1 Tax=Diphasiastrum complanatum TaxID=34168 RepID=A0ACC2EPS4_DIPCM|nr:hypothetical protein O6H91_Y049700 [Diphasiastrum complanatum]KAJ7568496.1 hypothetical protein O6H91_01G034600 [Diphasiastrum complanatum]